MGSSQVQIITCPVCRLKIMVCDSVIMMMHTRSAGGPLGLALLLSWMAPDHESSKLNHCAATKVVCSAEVPKLP